MEALKRNEVEFIQIRQQIFSSTKMPLPAFVNERFLRQKDRGKIGTPTVMIATVSDYNK